MTAQERRKVQGSTPGQDILRSGEPPRTEGEVGSCRSGAPARLDAPGLRVRRRLIPRFRAEKVEDVARIDEGDLGHVALGTAGDVGDELKEEPERLGLDVEEVRAVAVQSSPHSSPDSALSSVFSILHSAAADGRAVRVPVARRAVGAMQVADDYKHVSSPAAGLAVSRPCIPGSPGYLQRHKEREERPHKTSE